MIAAFFKEWLSQLFIGLLVFAGIFAVFLQNWWLLGLCAVIMSVHIAWPSRSEDQSDGAS